MTYRDASFLRQVLRASDNQISELSGLKDCLVLETLDLTNNRTYLY